MTTKKKTPSIEWVRQGWQPTYIGFCPTQGAWAQGVKRYNLQEAGDWLKGAPARCHRFKTKEGKCYIIITMEEGVEQRVTLSQIIGLLVHESVHAWQYVLEYMGEDKPGWEIDAFSIQCIFQDIYQGWWDTRGKTSPCKS